MSEQEKSEGGHEDISGPKNLQEKGEFYELSEEQQVKEKKDEKKKIDI